MASAEVDERVQSEKGPVQESPVPSPALPKEGGVRGWMQVFGTLFILFNIW
jgi:hypothetical protein